MDDTEKLVLTPEEARKKLGISRGLIYTALRQGSIPSLRVGRRILIPSVALERLLEGQGDRPGAQEIKGHNEKGG